MFERTASSSSDRSWAFRSARRRLRATLSSGSPCVIGMMLCDQRTSPLRSIAWPTTNVTPDLRAGGPGTVEDAGRRAGSALLGAALTAGCGHAMRDSRSDDPTRIATAAGPGIERAFGAAVVGVLFVLLAVAAPHRIVRRRPGSTAGARRERERAA